MLTDQPDWLGFIQYEYVEADKASSSITNILNSTTTLIFARFHTGFDMALAAYRHILRASRIAFAGDAPVLLAAQNQIRNEFRQKAALEDASGIQEAVRHAEGVAQFLRENLVQGKKMDGDDAMYKLRIHEHTERGDNESIKTAGKGKASGSGCCQS
ncbi:hypothetical protein N3K66_000993 [Trichothecium roseum]|uniref:Uncharacterized protein n=1 Tax=Trichothecium roseum TaxID=47278 RepID=A0ACC0VDI3_9HYPO|nr:hypothetical protein N3K66_000993 [Trichothecium roseum]